MSIEQTGEFATESERSELRRLAVRSRLAQHIASTYGGGNARAAHQKLYDRCQEIARGHGLPPTGEGEFYVLNDDGEFVRATGGLGFE